MNARPRSGAPNRAERSRSPHRTVQQLTAIHATVAERLNHAEARYTKRRRALVDVLANASQPLTVEEIQAASAAPQSSVYRNLTVLEEAHLVHRLTNNNSDYARYELAEDLLGHHHHLACATCGTMTDIVLPNQLEADLDRVLALLARKQRFTIDGHRLDIIGTCATCADP